MSGKDTGTKAVFGRTIVHNMSEGFPLLTTKKMYWKGIVEELLWFLRGDTNIRSLVEKGVNIWNGDAYKVYHPQLPEFIAEAIQAFATRELRQ